MPLFPDVHGVLTLSLPHSLSDEPSYCLCAVFGVVSACICTLSALSRSCPDAVLDTSALTIVPCMSLECPWRVSYLFRAPTPLPPSLVRVLSLSQCRVRQFHCPPLSLGCLWGVRDLSWALSLPPLRPRARVSTLSLLRAPPALLLWMSLT